jgi:hypothetical protein
VAPIVMGTDGGMNRIFVAKLQETQPVYDNDGHIHAPPVHPGMPTPTISGPREDPQAGMKTASVQKSGLFGGLFDRTTTQSTGQVAAANTSSSSDGFFARLFKSKSEPAPQPAPQPTTLAAVKPTPEPRKVDTARLETAKSASPKAEAQKAETPAAPRPSAPAPQVASAVPSAGLIKGAQPLVPSGSFDSRWAGLQ